MSNITRLQSDFQIATTMGGVSRVATIPAVVTAMGYTSSGVAQRFAADYNTLLDIYNAEPPATDAQATTMTNVIKDLQDLVANGIPNPSAPNDPTKNDYVTTELLNSVTVLFSALGAQGVTIDSGITGTVVPTTAVTAWQTLPNNIETGIAPVLKNVQTYAVSALDSVHSSQALVELIYVKQANDLLAQKLAGLQQATKTTQDALNVLASLQNLSNQVTFSTKAPFVLPPDAGMPASAYAKIYQKAASAYYGEPVVPIPIMPSAYPPNDGHQANLLNAAPANTFLVNIPVGSPDLITFLSSQGRDSVYAALASNGNNLNAIYKYEFRTTGEQGELPYLTVLPNSGLSKAFLDRYGLTEGVEIGGGSNMSGFLKELDFAHKFSPCLPPIQLTSTTKGVVITPEQATNLGSYLAILATPTSYAYQLKPWGGTFLVQAFNNRASAPAGALVSNPSPGVVTVLSKIRNSALFASTFRDNLINARTTLSGVIAGLATASGQTSPNSLQQTLITVLNGIKTAFVTGNGTSVTSTTPAMDAYAGIVKWLVDGYTLESPNSPTAGQKQQQLTAAITAGQSMNDAQKQKISQYLYVFEEFYKSAANVLSQLSQIIQKMAQNVNR